MQQPNSLFLQQPNMYVGIQQHNFPAQPIMIQPQQQNFRLPPLRAISEHGILSEYSDFGEDPEYKNIAEKSISRQGKNKGCGKLKAAKRVTQNETIMSKIATTLLLQYDDFWRYEAAAKKIEAAAKQIEAEAKRDEARANPARAVATPLPTTCAQLPPRSPPRARSRCPAQRPARSRRPAPCPARAVAAQLFAPRAQSPHRPLHASPASPSTPLNSKAEG